MRSLTFHYSASRQRRPGIRSRARGFTLLELMTVVIIIGILMVIAVPGIAHRMDEYRAMQTANEIAALYRNARMRALARGSAMTVRFNQTAKTFEVLESVEGDPNCARRASTLCQTASTNQNLLNRVVLRDDQAATLTDPAGEEHEAYDICFTPAGAARSRESNVSTESVSPMGGISVVSVSRGVGLTRNVLVLPNGSTRVMVPGSL